MTGYELTVKIFQTIFGEKVLVTLAVTAISILTVIYLPSKADFVITAAFTGLFGIVGYTVGTMRRAGDNPPPTNGKPPEMKS